MGRRWDGRPVAPAAAQLRLASAHPVRSVRRSTCTTRSWGILSQSVVEGLVGSGSGTKESGAVKESGYIWGLGTIFFAVVAVVYGVWSQDWAGTTALAFTGFMTALVAFYFALHRQAAGQPPGDDQMAEQEADPRLRVLQPHSWWPLPLGASAMMIALGLSSRPG